MRFLSTILLSAALAACATSAPSAPAAAPTPVAPAPARSPIALMLASAGQPNAATEDAVQRALGTPDVARRDGAGAALTYRFDHCALLLLFANDAHNTLRLSEADSGPRHVGDPAPTLDACATEAEARVQRR